MSLPQLRQMLQARFGVGAGGGGGGETDDAEDEEEEDDDDGLRGMWGGSGRRRRTPKSWYPVVTEPVEAGVRLERSGDFGPVSIPSSPVPNPRTDL